MKSAWSGVGTRSIVEIGLFSAAANLLLLVPPIYMIQVYDRVLVASSLSTLAYLTMIAVAGLAVLGILDIVRSYYAGRVAARLAAHLGQDAFLMSLSSDRAETGDVQPLRDVATVRGFISSRMLTFLFDLPFAPVFLVLLYFIHPLLFWVTVAGAVLLFGLAFVNQMASSRSDRAAGETLTTATGFAQSFARNVETVRALGMLGNTQALWGDRYAESLRATDRSEHINAGFSGTSRALRMGLQMVILGLGAFLVIEQEITAGMIFASSIISGRALQPLDQIVGAWPQIVGAARAWTRLSVARAKMAGVKDIERVDLPAPQGKLSADNLVYQPPTADRNAEPVIKRISFVIEAGETVSLIGPSRAGKSTLARLLVGAIRPSSGIIRLDGADMTHWDPDKLGRHVGYLSQEVELLPGTIAQNIARFDPDVPMEKVIAAANLAQVHDMIQSQKDGYATRIGPGGVRLSGGESQRIGLARALYDEPRLIVLDEPNANLDTEGEAALERALALAKGRGATVVIVTHRPSIATKCDRIMMLRQGRIELFGPAMEVLQRLQQGPARAQPQPPPPEPAPQATGAFSAVMRVGAQQP